MSLSVPISVLKSKARLLKRTESIPWCEALDRVARQEGYSTWGLLMARTPREPKTGLWQKLDPGDLVLLGARPGHGKTVCAVKIAVAAMRRGHKAWFFSLENDPPDLPALFVAAGARLADFVDQLGFDNSAGICARYISDKTQAALGHKAVIVIDYLQLLDQRRSSAELQDQVQSLRSLARQSGCIVVFIAQIDRSFDDGARRLPAVEDVRLPNPVDMGLFDKAVFLHDGRARLQGLGA